MKRRKIRRYKNVRRNSGVKFAGILVIMVTAVICGYLTARFVIAPLLGYDTEVLKLDFPSKFTAIAEQDESKSAKEEKKKGYALQFGVFSEKERAEKLSRQLNDDGIDVRIRESDGKYKVTGQLLETKQEAVTMLKGISTTRVSGIFITVI